MDKQPQHTTRQLRHVGATTHSTTWLATSRRTSRGGPSRTPSHPRHRPLQGRLPPVSRRYQDLTLFPLHAIFPFADDKRVMKTVFSKRKLFYGQPSPFVSCINTIFAMQVVNLRISYGELVGCWSTSSTDSPSYNPVTGIVRIRWQLARDASFGRPRITSKKILNMRIAHPRVRVWMDMCIRSVPKMSGEIKPETTIREFLEWSDVLDLDENRASDLFVKEPIIHA